MTKVYEKLQTGPQTGIDRSNLNYEERSEVRAIDVRGTTGLAQVNNPGKFTNVFYLDGDEAAAAELFAEVNADLIAAIDLSARNVLQTSLPRHMYDLILDAAGRREIRTYPTVVFERREDGTIWLIDRDRYETRVDRRYTTSETGSARVPSDLSLETLYENYGSVITESDLRETTIDGDVRQVLDYYRVASGYHCQPTTTETGELAITKIEETD
ncbi:hypothetical protein [Haloarcula nitratireducens]|uniref:Uncharacterized protein n=1 Tax=Haloarcula nitratireducens TaxID=2487749 RepID=A0AAW4PIM6_9EURY|nr:hypothetical protein [Halomicroarcula nitratireducens]MBX0297811.1 hypothetical protein [Halomicroarcula nitratireducens]